MTCKIILQGIPYYITSPWQEGMPLSASEASFLNNYRAQAIAKAAAKRLLHRPQLQPTDALSDLESSWQLPSPPEAGQSALEIEVALLRQEHGLAAGEPLPPALQVEARRRLELRRKLAMKELAAIL